MAEIIWRQKAIESRIEILRYGRFQYGETAARRLNSRLEECTGRLRLFPEMGFIEPVLIGRSVVYRSIMLNARFKMIYCTVVAEGVEYVEIVEIWDTQMNPAVLKSSVSEH